MLIFVNIVSVECSYQILAKTNITAARTRSANTRNIYQRERNDPSEWQFSRPTVFADLVLAAVMSVFAKIWYEHSTETTFYENQHLNMKIQRTLKVQIQRSDRARLTDKSPEYMDSTAPSSGPIQLVDATRLKP